MTLETLLFLRDMLNNQQLSVAHEKFAETARVVAEAKAELAAAIDMLLAEQQAPTTNGTKPFELAHG